MVSKQPQNVRSFIKKKIIEKFQQHYKRDELVCSIKKFEKIFNLQSKKDYLI